MHCIICRNCCVKSFSTNDNKTYWECTFCYGKFLDKSHYISNVLEKNRYLEHNNDINDEGYKSFLKKLTGPLLKKISTGAEGLDFGCGHGPALAGMLE